MNADENNKYQGLFRKQYSDNNNKENRKGFISTFMYNGGSRNFKMG